MKGLKSSNLLHVIIILYLFAAFTWWAILLYKKNEENYQLKQQLATYDTTLDREEIKDKYLKQKKMIYGEGLFFGTSILLGLLLINRAYRKELGLNQKLNDFLLSVTHELKTPIASLKLVNQTLRRTDLAEDKKQNLLEIGWDESLRLEALVNNILTAAQIEQEYTFNLEDTDLDALISKRIARYKKLFPLRDID